MKTKHANTLSLALAAAVLSLATSTPAGAQSPPASPDLKPIDITQIPAMPGVRLAYTLTAPASGKLQVPCHTAYEPGKNDGPTVIAYFAVCEANQTADGKHIDLQVISYFHVPMGTVIEMSPSRLTRIVVLGGEKPFLPGRDLDKMPTPPGAEAPKPKSGKPLNGRGPLLPGRDTI